MGSPPDPRADVVEAGRILASADQGDMVWGHVSVRDPAGRGVWVKRSGVGLDEAQLEDILLVNWDGTVAEGHGRAHIEVPIHTEVMKSRSDANSTVHTHPEHCNAFSSLVTPLRPISHDATLFVPPDVPRFDATRGLISTAELGAAVARTLEGSPVVFLVNHGIVTVGKTVGAAVMAAVLLDRACRVQLLASAAGGPVTWTSDEEARAKREQCWSDQQLATGYTYLVRRRPG